MSWPSSASALERAGGEYKVYKNTLVKLATAGHRPRGAPLAARGPTAIAFVNGEISAVAKALRDYARTNPHLVVKGGMFGDGTALDLRAVDSRRPPTSRCAARPAGRFDRRSAPADGRPLAGASAEPCLRAVGAHQGEAGRGGGAPADAAPEGCYRQTAARPEGRYLRQQTPPKVLSLRCEAPAAQEPVTPAEVTDRGPQLPEPEVAEPEAPRREAEPEAAAEVDRRDCDPAEDSSPEAASPENDKTRTKEQSDNG